jgi:hypothetical protein
MIGLDNMKSPEIALSNRGQPKEYMPRLHKSAADGNSRKARDIIEADSIRRFSIEPGLLEGWGDCGQVVESAANAVVSRLSTGLSSEDASKAAEMLRFLDSCRRGKLAKRLNAEECAMRLAYIDFCRVGQKQGKLSEKESLFIAKYFDSQKRRNNA